MAAPKTVVTYALNGTTREFDFSFDYLSRSFVQITLIGETRKQLVLGTDFTFASNTRIRTNLIWGPPSWTLIEIRRVTSTTERLVDFQDASILRAADLNLSELQVLHVAEEAREAATETIGTNNFGHLDARGRRIVNVGNAVDRQDSLTYGQYQDDKNSAVSARRAAEAAMDKAKEWASSSGNVEGTLRSSKYYSEQASISATASANSAAFSDQRAKFSDQRATAAANSASAAASSAAASANSATASAASAAISEQKADASSASAAASAASASFSDQRATVSDQKATAAANSASAAANSASAAASSATTSTQKATEAANSATAAASSATTSTQKATAAANSASAAASSASASSSSATASQNARMVAEEYAQKPVNVPVSTGGYSALHWASKAEAWAQQAGAVPLAVQQVASAIRSMYAGLIGVPVPYPSTAIPAGWVEMRGQSFDTAKNPLLATKYPSGVLPDMRKRFIRGTGADRGPLTFEANANKSHSHTITVSSGGSHGHTGSAASAGSHTHTVSGTADWGGAHTHTFAMSGSLGTILRPVGGKDTVGGNFTLPAEGAHTHSVYGTAASAGEHTHTVSIAEGGAHSHTGSASVEGSTDSRPDNIAFVWCCMTDTSIPELPTIGI